MPHKTYSDADVVRIFCNHLDEREKKNIVLFFLVFSTLLFTKTNLFDALNLFPFPKFAKLIAIVLAALKILDDIDEKILGNLFTGKMFREVVKCLDAELRAKKKVKKVQVDTFVQPEPEQPTEDRATRFTPEGREPRPVEGTQFEGFTVTDVILPTLAELETPPPAEIIPEEPPEEPRNFFDLLRQLPIQDVVDAEMDDSGRLFTPREPRDPGEPTPFNPFTI